MTPIICEEAPHTYTPHAFFQSVRPGVHLSVHWSHGYHGPEEDAQMRADALKVVAAVSELDAMLEALREVVARHEALPLKERLRAGSIVEPARALLARIDREG